MTMTCQRPPSGDDADRRRERRSVLGRAARRRPTTPDPRRSRLSGKRRGDDGGGGRVGAAPLLVVACALLAASASVDCLPPRAAGATAAAAFVLPREGRIASSLHRLSKGRDDVGDGDDGSNGLPNDDDVDGEGDDGGDGGLSWRMAKVRLEEANTRRLLRRKPLKLPYAASQKWIQRNWAPKTQQEFEDLVANGNLRTPYISKRPEEYYGARGEWISWDHYLLGEGGVGNVTGVSRWQ